MHAYIFNEKEHENFIESDWAENLREEKIKYYESQVSLWKEKEKDAETLIEYYDKVLWEETGFIRGDKRFDHVKAAIQEKQKMAKSQIWEYEQAIKEISIPICSYFSFYKEKNDEIGRSEHDSYFGLGNWVDVVYRNASCVAFRPKETRCNGCIYKLCKKAL